MINKLLLLLMFANRTLIGLGLSVLLHCFILIIVIVNIEYELFKKKDTIPTVDVELISDFTNLKINDSEVNSEKKGSEHTDDESNNTALDDKPEEKKEPVAASSSEKAEAPEPAPQEEEPAKVENQEKEAKTIPAKPKDNPPSPEVVKPTPAVEKPKDKPKTEPKPTKKADDHKNNKPRVDSLKSLLENKQSKPATKSATKGSALSESNKAGKPAISANERGILIKRIKKEWNVPIGIPNITIEGAYQTIIRFKLNKQGKITSMTVVEETSGEWGGIFTDTAKRAVYKAQDYDFLPKEKYEGANGWNEIELTFTPKGIN